MKQERGVTLIELMLAVAIVGTLASLALPSYMEFVRKSRRAEQAVLIPYFEKNVKLPFGEFPGRAFLGLATNDTFTHGWDLAKATGQSTDLAPDLAAALLAGAKQAISPAFRGPEGAPFGTEQEAPAGSTNADKLAAFLGRTV